MVGVQTSISAVDFFAAKLAHQTDPSDLAAARAASAAPLVLDVRARAGWDQGRIPGAVHAPADELAQRARELVPDLDTEVVVYCWGPGCNGSTKAALVLASLGYTRVRELIGGFEYWAREGLAVVTDAGRTRRAPDELTAPVPAGASAQPVPAPVG
ncbi:rhodanese-like domain-containing protein [Kineococcus gypseus]|uniref:rhodanese-like domain-containing protein n=1 Tax=Kineococcus gypseus TaxID=1637102 RepID=UPI003D7EF57D